MGTWKKPRVTDSGVNKNYVPEEWEGETEADRVQAWRAGNLVRAGVSLDVAEVLAATEADLHKLLKAFKAGMTERQAVEIFT